MSVLITTPRLLTVDMGAEVLGVKSRHVRRLIARGDLRGVRVGRFVRLDVADLDAFIKRGGAPFRPDESDRPDVA